MTSIPPAPFDLPSDRRRPRMREIHPDLREAVFSRARGCCELCEGPLRKVWEAHHRKLRSQGGVDEVTNLLALCLSCHRRVHSNVEWAYDTGFLVRRDDDPASARLALHLKAWVLLLTNGAYQVLPS